MTKSIPFNPEDLENSSAEWHIFDYDSKDMRCVSTAVLSAVSSVTGVPAKELTPPLYQLVEPDSLNDIFFKTDSYERAAGVVAFEMEECLVVLYAGGPIAVRPPSYTTDESATGNHI